jgi:carboxymethylenebutenolidase
MDQRVIDLYDDYTHSRLDRRQFLDRLATLTGSVAAGMALVKQIEANPAAAAMIPADDSRLDAGRVTYPGSTGEVRAYRAAPKGASGPLGSVMVIHENRGLNAHIEDVARRAAAAGFVALAPDLLSSMGGTPEDADRARDMIGQLPADRALADAAAGVTWLARQQGANGRVGTVGFCWGGGMSGQLAAANPDGLACAVVFYGRTVEPAKVPGIEVPLLLHYAGKDERINAGIPEFRQALDAAGARYTLHMYEGAQHAFHNDTSAERYSAEAAQAAWDRTVAFFREHLAGEA